MPERLLIGPGSPPSIDPVYPELSPPPEPCLNMDGPLVEIGSGSCQFGCRCQAVANGGGSPHDLTPLVGRGAAEQWPAGRWGPTRFPECQSVGDSSALSADLLAEWG